MNIPSIKEENGLKILFYEKLKLYSNSWDGKMPIKEVNRKFSLLFLTKEQTYLVLRVLEQEGMVEIKKSDIVIK